MNRIEKLDGFQGQIQYVIPRPLLVGFSRHILVSGLYPSDIGWYPNAKYHRCLRAEGTEQNILILCVKGSGWFRIDGRRRNLLANEALLVPKGKAHEYGASQRDPWSILWMHFAGEDASYYLNLLKGDNFTLRIHPDLIQKIERLFGDAYDAFSNGINQESVICSSQAIRHILALLFFSNKAFVPNSKTGSARNLDLVMQFMKEHVDASLTVAQMAAQAQLSPTHFSRLFTQRTGASPMDYFIHLKIQRACRFLTLTPLSIKEISSRLGYSDQYYFSRIFRKVMGLSPVNYRQIKLG